MVYRITTGVVFASVAGFTAFFWYMNSTLAAKSLEVDLSEGAATTLRLIMNGNNSDFLPMLAGISILAFAAFGLSFSQCTQCSGNTAEA